MDLTAELATNGDAAKTPFGAVLRDVITEMEAAENPPHTFEDAVQNLSLAAHLALSVSGGGPLPRMGIYAYRLTTVTPPEKSATLLDVRY